MDACEQTKAVTSGPLGGVERPVWPVGSPTGQTVNGRIRLRLAGLLMILLCPPAAGGTIPVGGDYGDHADFAANPALGSLGLVSFGAGFGSGVYIGDGWVVTAAHVADSASSFTFAVGGTVHASDDVRIPEAWSGNVTAGSDVGLIHLAGDVADLNAAVLYTGSNRDLLGESLVLSGYGRTGTGATGAIGSGGTLYAGTNTADMLGGDLAIFRNYDSAILFVDFDDPTASTDGYPWSAADAGDLEYMVAPGDSGGGVFLLTEEGASLVGVNSFVLALDGDPNSDYGDMAGVTLLARHLEWIEEGTELPIRDHAPGDATGDGLVDGDDLSVVLSNWTGGDGSGGTRSTGDLDGDGTIADDDLSILLAYWSARPMPADVPEPATSAVVFLGGGLLLVRRRRP